MTLTLLLDLDDTLLGNNVETFIPAYLQALNAHMRNWRVPATFAPSLLAATRQMLSNNQPTRTLQQTFEQHFYPELGIEPAVLADGIDDFYQHRFPDLRAITQVLPQAQELVRIAEQRGWRLAIATNPLFPRVAILHRLAWAGLPAHEHPFALISSYETFHFAKPNPAYYAEFLAQLGWQEGAVVMVGNDWQDDILPARRLGLPAYWVTESAPQTLADPLIGWGPLANLTNWVDSQPEGTLNPRFDTPEALQAILRANPAAAATLLARISPENRCRRPSPDIWAACEILCHLRDVEREVNLPRVQAILGGENPFIPLVNSDPWAETRNYICQNSDQALQEFCNARLELLALLENCSPQDWQRPARHAIFGPTTLLEITDFLTRHDQLHVRQLFEAA